MQTPHPLFRSLNTPCEYGHVSFTEIKYLLKMRNNIIVKNKFKEKKFNNILQIRWCSINKNCVVITTFGMIQNTKIRFLIYNVNYFELYLLIANFLQSVSLTYFFPHGKKNVKCWYIAAKKESFGVNEYLLLRHIVDRIVKQNSRNPH